MEHRLDFELDREFELFRNWDEFDKWWETQLFCDCHQPLTEADIEQGLDVCEDCR